MLQQSIWLRTLHPSRMGWDIVQGALGNVMETANAILKLANLTHNLYKVQRSSVYDISSPLCDESLRNRPLAGPRKQNTPPV